MENSEIITLLGPPDVDSKIEFEPNQLFNLSTDFDYRDVVSQRVVQVKLVSLQKYDEVIDAICLTDVSSNFRLRRFCEIYPLRLPTKIRWRKTPIWWCELSLSFNDGRFRHLMTSCFRFLLVAMHCNWALLQGIALDTLSNIATEVLSRGG